MIRMLACLAAALSLSACASSQLYPYEPLDSPYAPLASSSPQRPLLPPTPFEQLTEARRPLTQNLLQRVERDACPLLAVCLSQYERDVRRLAAEVNYTTTSADELTFRAVREIARASDEGTITQTQAVNRILLIDAEIEAASAKVRAARELREQQLQQQLQAAPSSSGPTECVTEEVRPWLSIGIGPNPPPAPLRFRTRCK